MRSIALVLGIALLSGCAGFEDDKASDESPLEACLDGPAAELIFERAEDHVMDLLSDLDETFTIVLVGTLEGEIDTMTISYDAPANAALISGNEFDMRTAGGFYSVVDASLDGFYGRDMDPASSAKAFLEEILGEDDLGVSFADDPVASDYAVECSTLGGQEVVTFTYDDGTVQDVFTVERASPHRTLTGSSVDPALQDNFRFSISYDDPNIVVDSSQPRIFPTFEVLLESYDDVGDGMIELSTFGADTEWVPIADLDLLIVDEYGDPWDLYEFEPGLWEIDEGYYEFRDIDQNGLLSAGDSIEVGLQYGFDWGLFDNWADDTADIIYA